MLVYDAGPALDQHWFDVSCLLGHDLVLSTQNTKNIWLNMTRAPTWQLWQVIIMYLMVILIVTSVSLENVMHKLSCYVASLIHQEHMLLQDAMHIMHIRKDNARNEKGMAFAVTTANNCVCLHWNVQNWQYVCVSRMISYTVIMRISSLFVLSQKYHKNPGRCPDPEKILEQNFW